LIARDRALVVAARVRIIESRGLGRPSAAGGRGHPGGSPAWPIDPEMMAPVKWTLLLGLTAVAVALWLAAGLSSPFLSVCAALAALAFGPARRRLTRWAIALRRWAVRERGRHTFGREPLLERLADIPAGRRCRVRGRVLPGDGFTSAGGRKDAVLAAYLGTTSDPGPEAGGALGRWELHGVDFSLALAEGERVRVMVARASLVTDPPVFDEAILDRPPALARQLRGRRGRPRVARLYEEEVIAAGDVVEVLGFLERRVDPHGQASHRGTPMGLVLCGRPLRRLLIRPSGA
jgi:hypothetical protein